MDHKFKKQRADHLIVIQPSSLCNLNCNYCYVPDRLDPTKMSEVIHRDVLKKLSVSPIIRKNLEFLWHCGEPLTVGIDFYERHNQFVSEYFQGNFNVLNHIQTNAVLINDEWAQFFKEYNYMVTVSVDGPAHIHDANRVNWKGKPSHQMVMKGLSILDKYDIPYAAIAVVSEHSLDYPNEIFDFFTSNNFKGVALNAEKMEGANTISSLFGKEQLQPIQKYKHFIKQIYKRWNSYESPFVVREFQGLLSSFVYKMKHPKSTTYNSLIDPFANITISKTGEVFTFSPEFASGTDDSTNYFSLGNIKNVDTFDEFQDSNKFKYLYQDIMLGVKNCAETCMYFDFCGGGCPSAKFYENKSLASTSTNQCLTQKKIIFETVLNEQSKSKVMV